MFLSTAHLPAGDSLAAGAVFIPPCSDVCKAVPVLLNGLQVLLAASPAPSLTVHPAFLFSSSVFPLWVTLFTSFAYVISC